MTKILFRSTAVAAVTTLVLTGAAPASAAGLTLGRVVWEDHTGATTSIIATPALTAPPRSLLVATLTMGARPGATSVQGGRLTWTRRAKATSNCGSAEIWTAYTTRGFNAGVTARPAGRGQLTVAAFPGAGPDVGWPFAASINGGRPRLTMITRKPGSLVFAAGRDCDQAAPRRAAAGQRIVHQFADRRARTTQWTQVSTRPAAPGRVVIGPTGGAPSTRWQMVAIEVSRP